MPQKTRIAFNWIYLLFILVTGFLIETGMLFFSEGDKDGVLIGAILLTIPALLLVSMPAFYRFDAEGLTMWYLFLPNERYLWKNICAIEVMYPSRGFSHFKLYAEPEGKQRFYMQGEVMKSRRAKRLLEEYWDGKIEGFIFEGLRDWIRNRGKKPEKKPRPYFTDEVVLMERQARGEAREVLEQYEALAGQMDLELRTKYCYTDKELEETNSRPQSSYEYTVLVELSRPGETADDKVIITSADLLHVRLGRAAYRGVKDEDALPDLKLELDELFEEVRQKGLEAYLQEFEQ